MIGLARILTLSWLLTMLAGCQVTHTLNEPPTSLTPRLPAVSVQVTGAIPGDRIRNHMRSLGVFEQVREGHDPNGYNLIVQTHGDYMGARNIPNQLLSAFSLFLIPAKVNWDTRMEVHLLLADESLRRYNFANHTSHYNGLLVHPDGRGDNYRRLVGHAVAALQADAQLLDERPLVALYKPTPVAFEQLAEPVQVRARIQVRADGSVEDLQVSGEGSTSLHASVAEQLREWRFAPWIAAPEEASLRITTRRFTLRPGEGQLDIIKTFRQPCSELTAEVDALVAQQPQAPLADVPSFQKVSAIFLLASLQRPSQRGAIERSIRAFNNSLPWVVEQCRENPRDQYQHYLDQGLRRQHATFTALEQQLEHRSGN